MSGQGKLGPGRIGARPGELARAALPPALAGLGMGLGVTLIDRLLPQMPDLARLGALVASGGVLYLGWLMAFARERLVELVDLVRRR